MLQFACKRFEPTNKNYHCKRFQEQEDQAQSRIVLQVDQQIDQAKLSNKSYNWVQKYDFSFLSKIEPFDEPPKLTQKRLIFGFDSFVVSVVKYAHKQRGQEMYCSDNNCKQTIYRIASTVEFEILGIDPDANTCK